jgi:DNA-binding MarR family transcriptional regulator
MSMQLIREYLAANPEGANPEEIGEHLGLDKYSISQSIRRLLDRELVRCVKQSRSRMGSIYVAVPGKKVFNTYETLAAMQRACRARLMRQPVTEEV